MRASAMRSLFVASLTVATLASCRARGGEPTSGQSGGKSGSVDPAKQVEESEQRAIQRGDEHRCERPRVVYSGSIRVSASDYRHPVARGDDYVEESIPSLDNVISPAKSVRFTLDYPFERPFSGVVTGEITLRRTIDAIRAGFRKMYEGSTQRDVPGMANKDVTGTYGQAFHVIDDLVIETIELCADDSLSIFIGS